MSGRYAFGACECPLSVGLALARVAALVASGELESRLEPAPDPRDVKRWRIFGWIALSLGIGMVLLILYAAIFGYR